MNAMKYKCAKICSAIPFVVYGVGTTAFLLGRFDHIYGYDPANPPLDTLLKTVGDIANAVFLFTLAFGWVVALPFSTAGAVLSALSKNMKGQEICFDTSLVNSCIAIVWAAVFVPFVFHLPSPSKPSPVYNLSWHFLDDSLQGEKIVLTCTAEYEDPPVVKKRTVTAGKTRKIRLPDRYFNDVRGVPQSDESVRIFVPGGFFINWTEDWDRFEKRDAYEIIVYRQPHIDEDEEQFTMKNPPRDATFTLCYWDKMCRRFVHIDSADGVFRKRDKSEELLLGTDFDYPDSAEQFSLFMTVQSAVDAGMTFPITLSYARAAHFCPTRVLRTYTQNGREITTLNLELDGTNWVRTRFVSKDEKPIANAKAVVYVLFEDSRTSEEGEPLDTEIYAETDADGYLEVQGIPDGAECYIDFED